jgi:outer membrane protein OmpA-like peptidoglycan-associated protein
MRTGSDKGEFTLESLEPDAMKINTRTLDIVGKRMQGLQNTELTITGTIDTKNEKTDKDLSRKRAEFARDYLVKTYKINPEKINIRLGGLPEKPSTLSVPEGAEENRRTEISSTNKNLLEPILMKKDNQSFAEPNLIEFVPYIKSTDSVISWQVDITQSDQNLRTFKGSGEAPPLQFVIIPNELKNSQIPIDYNFMASNSKGISKRVSGSIPVDYFSTTRKKSEDQPDKTISKYSLILFDFDKADVSSEDMKIIDEYIIPDIKFNSSIKIYGFTDRIGDEIYNKKLAGRRAEAVQLILQNKVKNNKIEAFGVGENEMMFDNNSPIGRQLSRTVQIYVITPK